MISNIIVKDESIDNIWLAWWNIVKDNIDKQESRDGDVVFECINASTIITNPTRSLSTNKIRDMSVKYAIGEYLWYEASVNLLRPIQKYTKGWDRMSDDGIHVNSNYGYLIRKRYGFDQFDMCYEILKSNPLSRQAIIHFKPAMDDKEMMSKDVPCTLYQQFFIRDGKLHSIVNMRSNDLWNGVPYDVFFFTCNQIKLAMKLDVEVGTYMHNAGSLHMYARDYETAVSNEDKIHKQGTDNFGKLK